MIMTMHRAANWLWRHKVPLFPTLIYGFVRVFFSAVLPPSADIGRGTTLAYSGLGVVIHARAKIGRRVHISAKATVGGRAGLYEVPVVGDDVLIGSGAQIIGPVRIGDGAKIGANAVVLEDVPAGATVVGIPARVVAPNGPSAQQAVSSNGGEHVR